VVWGHWALDSDLTGGLDEADRRRLTRAGILPMPTGLGLALFDAAVSRDDAVLVAARLARDAVSSPLLRDLAVGRGLPRRRAVAATPDAPPTVWRDQALAELVHSQVATVLGHEPGTPIDPARPFKDLGFDSLTAVELRNRLAAATGLRLPATLVFDHPTPVDLIAALRGRLTAGETTATEALLAELDRIDEEIDSLEDRSQLVARLRGLLAKHVGAPDDAQRADGAGRTGREAVETATDDEMFALIDSEIGAG
jgi:acyl carrier protein